MTNNTTAAELLALAERVEAATGANADLQHAIMTQAMGYRDIFGDRRLFDRGNAGYWTMADDDAGQQAVMPDPTASIDAAMTLVPEGAFWRVGHDGEGSDPSLFAAIVGVAKVGEQTVTFRRAVADTAPLALTAATLRARAAELGEAK